jgi:hypothetical protein
MSPLYDMNPSPISANAPEPGNTHQESLILCGIDRRPFSMTVSQSHLQFWRIVAIP